MIAAYLRLMRFHKPVGFLLLWFPTAWALWLANQGMPSWSLLCYFALGTIVMRAAGCVINDIADRQVDGYVERTKNRPLASKELTLQQAWALLFVLCLVAFFIVLQLPPTCFLWSLGALLVTGIYPFCKRFLHAPQAVLGVAFSMGIPMAFAASQVPFNRFGWWLLLINFCWIMAYDTLYAMVDKKDDLRIGIQSTAILFGRYDRTMVVALQMIAHISWLVLAYLAHYSAGFYLFWGLAACQLIYQMILFLNREAYFKAFSSNMLYGLLMWLAICF